MRLIKTTLCFLVILFSVKLVNAQKEISFTIEKASAQSTGKDFYKPGNSLIQYYGRIQKTNEGLPRFWAPGVYIKSKIYRG